ncbi:hypothetical protein FJT64_008959 [Amphibalanus amphitrite]|uniref:Uncharacterized protein n=1 Tax=Amphibalanus amphitrite TaxID=1232801 RepID=A0A6A4VT15_AMPAM|nr:hypothetical protein FJT64_008959 [Amphibalanus amphitrite]
MLTALGNWELEKRICGLLLRHHDGEQHAGEREWFRLTAAEAQVIRRCALFVVCTYAAAAAAAAWSRTLLSATAPALDLTFVNSLNSLCTYTDKELSKATVLVFGRHL